MISSRFVYHSNPIRIAVLAVATALLAGPVTALAATPDRAAIAREVANRHDEAVKRLRAWIALPSIAAEGLNSRDGAETMARPASQAGEIGRAPGGQECVSTGKDQG